MKKQEQGYTSCGSMILLMAVCSTCNRISVNVAGLARTPNRSTRLAAVRYLSKFIGTIILFYLARALMTTHNMYLVAFFVSWQAVSLSPRSLRNLIKPDS
ncbi:hypothetical protein DFH27DRAFT_570454 [Peziza echinospora]|nr:hypothetical protein DFH27DRAFT_570454 [Peziza echinospora]